MNKRNLFSFLVLILCCSACVGPVKQDSLQTRWPQNIPEYSYYQQLYALDEVNQQVQSAEDYLTWVLRFYTGWAGFAKGWLEASDQIIINTPEQDQDAVRSRLQDMGKRVSGEWAKKSKQRLIYTKDLAIWGDALSEAMYQERLLETIDSIDKDIHGLLNKEISSDDITMERYFSDQDFDQEFSMF